MSTVRRTMLGSGLAVTALVAAPWLVHQDAAGGERISKVVDEASGMVASRSRPVFWVHGDSGTPPVLYGLDRSGAVVERVEVRGATSVDWEDIASDGAGHLYIADSGNNANTRVDLAVYRVPEPAPGQVEVKVDRAVRFRYPDQRAFPDPTQFNFDGEALFWSEGRLYMLSKHRSDPFTTLYRFPADEGEVVLEKISDFRVGMTPSGEGGRVTAADLAWDGQRLAVLTYHALFLFPRPASGDDWLSGAPVVVPLDVEETEQCEALAWDGQALVVLNEGRRWWRLEDPLNPPARFP